MNKLMDCGRRAALAGAAVSVALSGMAVALDFTWLGGTGRWHDPAGWSRPGNTSGDYPGRDQNRNDRTFIVSGAATVDTALSRNQLEVHLAGGTLRLAADFSPGRTIQMSGGVLDVTANQSNGAILATGGTITGAGRVGGNGAVTFAAGSTHAPGGIGVVGSQVLGNNSRYQAGSIFSWDISGAAAFDTVSSPSSQVGGGTVVVNVLGVDFGSTFWNSNRAFLISDFQNGGWFTSLEVSGITSGGNFALGNPDSNDSVTRNYLYWNTNAAPNAPALPEPGGLLAGLLVAAGALRRQRAR